MTARTRISDKRRQLKSLGGAVPDVTAGFGALSKGAKDGGVLEFKVKEFIALGMAIATRCEPCILFHTDALRKAGATREEVADVCAMAVQMGGGPGLMYAAQALDIWDELTAPAAAAE
jgi:AhpD family alkylhydroperoxidase